MSAFQVNLTPTRLKCNKKRIEAREPTSVVMAPFSAKAIVTFEDVPVTKSARRILKVFNPSEETIQVMVTKGFKPENNITMEWTSNIVPSQTVVDMELEWNPIKEVACKETLQFTDNRNFRKDVMVILKSVPIKTTKTAKRFPNITTSTSHVKTLRLKSPTNSKQVSVAPQRKRQSIVQGNTNKTEKRQQKTAWNFSPLAEKNLNPHIIIDYNHVPTPSMKQTEKENVSPLTPGSISALIDNMQFTPATETRPKAGGMVNNLDYLASLPTPNYRPHGQQDDHFKNIQPRRLSVLCSPDDDRSPAKRVSTQRIRIPEVIIEKEEDNEGAVSSSEQLDQTDGEIRRVPINRTFNLKSDEDQWESMNDVSEEDVVQSFCEKPALNKTATLTVAPNTRPLAMIEEEASPSSYIVRTSKLHPNENLKRDVSLVGTPLRKYSESMRDLSFRSPKAISIQGSMPNLNEMESIRSIEQNRYFNPVAAPPTKDPDSSDISNTSLTSVVSHSELAFNHNEILAQSSRFNLNEIGQKSRRNSPTIVRGMKREITKTPTKPVTTIKEFGSPTSYTVTSKRFRESAGVDPNNSAMMLSVPKSQMMQVSPPKKIKYESDMFAPASMMNFRSSKWAQTQPKKPRIVKTLSLVKKSTTPRKIKEEPRVMLYDSVLYLQQCINPDPFAASTTCDPFLASTMYLDERSVDKHEKEFKKWLNALVTIPADFDPDCNQKIDVGKLFNEVRNKDLTLAPTKEEQSMNYLTKSRMDSLRRAAVQLFMSEEMREPCSKVAVYINKQAIRIRNERNLHLDVVMQREILELLLCFNPLWLRIGLEAVFGEIVHLHSNSDVIGLSTFILNRFVKDKFLEQKYSKAYTLSAEYAEHIKKFTLQKFLFLLLFLDKAKSKRIIKHNPCLFVKNSKHKEIKEILLRFSSQLLANVGDITKELRRLGYALTHKQNFIDEFDYAFKNLAVDLRDGIRLTKVMEIILLRDDMTQKLRVPAISRLQRVYNVNLGLTALAEADFTLRGNIFAADIVDGHREKTLSLLWQIIYKFRSPKFHAAATVLQKWWRQSWLKVCIQRRIRQKHEIRMNKCATIIQSAFRGYISRRCSILFRWERCSAALVLQKHLRRYIAQSRFYMTVRSVTLIQHWYRASKQGLNTRAQYIYIRCKVVVIQRWFRRLMLARKIEQAAPIIRVLKEEAKLRDEKALIIQRYIKSYCIRNRLRETVFGVIRFNRKSKLKYRSASRIQSFFQMIKLRREFEQKRNAATCIQQMWKSHQLTIQVREEFIQKRDSVIKIQQYYRSYKLMQCDRQAWLQLHSAVRVVQIRFKANKLAADQRSKYLETRGKLISIQQRLRATLLMRKDRQLYLTTREKIISLQSRVRAHLAMKLQIAEYAKTKLAAVAIQKYYRGRLAMKEEIVKFTNVRQKIIFIQQKWRATKVSRIVRAEFVTLQYSTIVIQQHFRANSLMKDEKCQYQNLRQSTIYIQRKFRSILQMRSDRKEFIAKRNAARTLQMYFKAYKEMKFVHAKFNGTKQAVICIQQRFRDYLKMKHERNEYVRLKSAAITIQQRFRAFKSTQIAQGNYKKLQNAVVCIQRKYRAMISMRNQRMEYVKVCTIVIKAQRRFRAKLLGREVRKEYEKLQQSVIIVQRRFRGKKLMQSIRETYSQQRNKIIKIQKYFRSYILMKWQRNEFLQQKNCIIKIQKWFRSVLFMRAERNAYELKIRSVIAIQRRVRETIQARRVRAEYEQTKQSVLCIQQRFRSYLVMQKQQTDYLQLKQNVVVVQQRYRAKLEMLKIRSQYMLVKSLIVCIQQKFRANRQMKIERSAFVRMRSAAIVIQQRYRGRIETRIEHDRYERLKSSTVQFQAYARGLLARRRYTAMMTPEMREFIKQKQAAKIIQRFWRGYRVRKKWQNLKIRTIRANLKEMKQVSQVIQNTVRFKVQESCRILRGRFSVTEALHVLTRLERMSRTVPHLLMDHSDFISTFCYGIMAQAIRSEVDKQLIELCSRIILNLARYNSTTANTFQESGLVTIAHMLLRWCDKDCDIFNTLCTLIWVFSHSLEKRKKIREFMTTPEAIYVVRETKKLVARKEKMKRNVRKPATPPTPTTRGQQGVPFMPRSLPNLEADYGVIRTKPYIFISSVYAFDTILCKLGIDIR